MNNFKSIICFVITTMLLKVVDIPYIKNSDNPVILLIIIILIISYIMYGFCFLNNLGSFRKNYLSIIAFVAIGLIVWIICFHNTDYKFLNHYSGDDSFLCEWWLDHDYKWQYFSCFSIFEYFMLPIQIVMSLIFSNNKDISTNALNSDILNIFNIFLPSLFLCIGIHIRIKLNKLDGLHY